MWAKHNTLHDIISLTLWYDRAQCFFFRTKLGTDVFNTTLLLSPRRREVSSTFAPISLNIVLYSRIVSTACSAATSSTPYVDISIVLWRFEIHLTGVLLINNKIPVTDLLVIRSCAWSESLYAVILTIGPRYDGSSSSKGSISFASG